MADFRLLARLGQGGMAEVWVARRDGPAGFSRQVVLKRVLPEKAGDPETLKMLLDEALLAARLQHSNVVQVSELLRVDTGYVIVMEYIPGRSLEQVVRRLRKRKLRLSAEAVATIAAQVCEGLQYAHEALDERGNPLGIVHRDITPQNLLITASGHVKIIDFGIARAESRIVQTTTGILKGKPSYMAPEQVHCRSVDGRTDLYGLGATMYELLTGERPYAGMPVHHVLGNLIKGIRPKHPAELRSALPGDLAAHVWKAMDPEPDSRWRTPAHLQRALEEWLQARERGAMAPRRLGKVMKALFPEGVDPVPPGSVKLPDERLRDLARDSSPFPAQSRPGDPGSLADVVEPDSSPQIAPVNTPPPAPMPAPVRAALNQDYALPPRVVPLAPPRDNKLEGPTSIPMSMAMTPPPKPSPALEPDPVSSLELPTPEQPGAYSLAGPASVVTANPLPSAAYFDPNQVIDGDQTIMAMGGPPPGGALASGRLPVHDGTPRSVRYGLVVAAAVIGILTGAALHFALQPPSLDGVELVAMNDY